MGESMNHRRCDGAPCRICDYRRDTYGIDTDCNHPDNWQDAQ